MPDIAQIPIGALSPQGAFSPEHAVRIHREVGSTGSVEVHGACWAVGDGMFSRKSEQSRIVCEKVGLRLEGGGRNGLGQRG